MCLETPEGVVEFGKKREWFYYDGGKIPHWNNPIVGEKISVIAFEELFVPARRKSR